MIASGRLNQFTCKNSGQDKKEWQGVKNFARAFNGKAMTKNSEIHTLFRHRTLMLYREVRMKKTSCSMNEKNADYIHANRYPVAASLNPLNLVQQLIRTCLRGEVDHKRCGFLPRDPTTRFVPGK